MRLRPMSIHVRFNAALSPPRLTQGAPLTNPDMRILNAGFTSWIRSARGREATGAGSELARLRWPRACAAARAVKDRSVLDTQTCEQAEG